MGWGLRAGEIEYAAVGFGSHHWRVVADGERWFVTVDDLDVKRRDGAEAIDEPLRRLTAALTTARSLRDAGLTFVVAPVLTRAGHIVHAIDDRFVAALYPYVDGEPHPWGPYPTRADRLAVVELVAALHRAPATARAVALVDDLAIPCRDQLEAALMDRAEPWASGPFGEPARILLDEHAEAVQLVFAYYDDLAAVVTRHPERMVLTHGEPHRGNTITTAEGVVLIDWDTTLIAPPERDLWALAEEDAETNAYYAARTGIVPNDDALELYRLWWDLTEVSMFVGQFRQPHHETEDTRQAWNGLTHYLDPTRWRPAR